MQKEQARFISSVSSLVAVETFSDKYEHASSKGTEKRLANTAL